MTAAEPSVWLVKKRVGFKLVTHSQLSCCTELMLKRSTDLASLLLLLVQSRLTTQYHNYRTATMHTVCMSVKLGLFKYGMKMG
jgi:hypothetical protein